MPVELRPLGVGEIFDRAVTLYVRNFAPFVLVAAFVAVPLSVVRYFIARSQQGYWAQLLEAIQHKQQHPQVSTMSAIVPFYAVLAVETVLFGFMYVAIAAMVWQLYERKLPDWRTAYRAALQRTGAVLSAVLAQVVGFLCLITAGTTAIVLLAAVSFLLLRSFAPLGIAAIILTIPCALALCCLLMLWLLCIALTYGAIAIEGLRFMQAIIAAYERIFNRREFGKALLMCLALAAIQIAAMIVGILIASVAIGMLHSPLLQAALAGVVSMISTGFIGVLVTVYYVDVRVRGEGLDMQAELDRLEMQPQA